MILIIIKFNVLKNVTKFSQKKSSLFQTNILRQFYCAGQFTVIVALLIHQYCDFSEDLFYSSTQTALDRPATI